MRTGEEVESNIQQQMLLQRLQEKVEKLENDLSSQHQTIEQLSDTLKLFHFLFQLTLEEHPLLVTNNSGLDIPQPAEVIAITEENKLLMLDAKGGLLLWDNDQKKCTEVVSRIPYALLENNNSLRRLIFSALKNKDKQLQTELSSTINKWKGLRSEIEKILLTAMEAVDPIIRDNAVERLVDIGINSEYVIQQLLELLEKSKNDSIRSNAAWAVSSARLSIEKVTQSLNKALNDPSAVVRRQALLSLIIDFNFSSPEIASKLVGSLGDYTQITDSLVEAFNKLSSLPAIQQGLAKALKDGNFYVYNNALNILGKFNNLTPTEDLVESLIAFIDKGHDPYQGGTLGTILKKMGAQPPVVQGLIKLLKHSDERISTFALWLLVDLKVEAPEVIDKLKTVLNDKNEQVQIRAAKALGHLDKVSPDVTRTLTQLLTKTTGYVKSQVIEVIGSLRIFSSEIGVALIKAVNEEDYSVSDRSMKALIQMGPEPELITLLFKALRPSSYQINYRVFRILVSLKVKDNDLISILISGLRESSTRFSTQVDNNRWGEPMKGYEAADTLIQFGPLPEIIKGAVGVLHGATSSSYGGSDRRNEGAIKILLHFGPVPIVIDELVKALGSQYHEVGTAVTDVFVRMGSSPAGINSMLIALDSENVNVAVQAMRILSKWKASNEEVVKKLQVALQNPNKEVQRNVLLTLVELDIKSPEVTQALLQAVLYEKDNRWGLQLLFDALVRWGSSPDIVDTLLTASESKDKYTRAQAVSLLIKLKVSEERVINMLLAYLRDPANEDRQSTILALIDLNVINLDVIRALIIVLSSPHLNLVPEFTSSLSGQAHSVLQAFLKLGPLPEVIKELSTTLFYHSNDNARANALYVLGKMKFSSPKIVQKLPEMLNHKSIVIQRSALYAISELNVCIPGSIDSLIKMLSNFNMNYNAINTLIKKWLENKEVKNRLIELFEDKTLDNKLHLSILWILVDAKISCPSIEKEIIHILQTKQSDEIYIKAIDSVTKLNINTTESVNCLLALIDSNSVDVRIASISALGNLKVARQEVVEAFLKALNDPYDRVRQKVIWALGCLGLSTPPILHGLFNALTDEGKSRDTLLLPAYSSAPSVFFSPLPGTASYSVPDNSTNSGTRAAEALLQLEVTPELIDGLINILEAKNTSASKQAIYIIEKLYSTISDLQLQLGQAYPIAEAAILKTRKNVSTNKMQQENPGIQIIRPSYRSESSSSAIPFFIPGLKFEKVPDDGSCLYHAVALYLGKTHQNLREEVASYIEQHLDEFRGFLQFSFRQSAEDYIRGIREGRERAANTEIMVLMRVFNRPTVVIGPDRYIRNQNDIQEFSGEPIFVYYNGHNHYDALTLDGTKSAQEILLQLTQSNNLPKTPSRMAPQAAFLPPPISSPKLIDEQIALNSALTRSEEDQKRAQDKNPKESLKFAP